MIFPYSLQICNPSLGPQPRRDVGREGHIRLLHRLCHGAHSPLPGPHAPHSHAGKFPQKESRFSEAGTLVSTLTNETSVDEPLQDHKKMDAAAPLPLLPPDIKQCPGATLVGAQLRRSLLTLLGDLVNSANQGNRSFFRREIEGIPLPIASVASNVWHLVTL